MMESLRNSMNLLHYNSLIVIISIATCPMSCGNEVHCGRGTIGSNCISTNDCECGLQCVSHVCIEDGDELIDGDIQIDTEQADDENTYDGDEDRELIDTDTEYYDGDVEEETIEDNDYEDREETILDGDQCLPTSHATAQCYQGDVWWYDSCGNREDKKSRCDPSGCLNAACISSSKFSCVDGICTDLVRGFEWQQTPAGERDGYMNWYRAISQCQHLDLDGSGWRLPTISELRSLIKGCADTELYHSSTQCGIYDDCLTCWNDECLGCSSNEGPVNGCYWKEGLDGTCSGYWSSSLPSLPGIDTSNAWSVIYNSAKIYNFSKYNSNYVRCVRCCVP